MLKPVDAERHSAPQAWDVVRSVRAVDRPGTGTYLRLAFDGFRELHGDRRYRDDGAIRGGIAWIGRQAVVVIGHERGTTLAAQERTNFGMPFPEDYHKARRLMCLADRFRLPVVTLIDTPGAYPGLGAEERGQAGAIAALLETMATLHVPTLSFVIGQGGSGGALALALADRVLMLEHAVYSVISPEGCASILWHSSDRAPEAAAALRLTAPDLLELGVIDEIVPEPRDGIAANPREAARRIRRAIVRHLAALRRLHRPERLERRAARYRAVGVFESAEQVDG